MKILVTGSAGFIAENLIRVLKRKGHENIQILDSNATRKAFVANQIIQKKPSVIGVYRLLMKEGSDNIRESAIQDILKTIIDSGIKVIIYEPGLCLEEIHNSKIYKNFEKFVNDSDLIIANRKSEELAKISKEIYTRDIFQEN